MQAGAVVAHTALDGAVTCLVSPQEMMIAGYRKSSGR
jgi:hypothetical protein